MLESLCRLELSNPYCDSLACLAFILDHTQNNQLIRKHVTYLVEKHLNVHTIYYNVLFLIVKSYLNLSSLLHNLTYLSLLSTFLLLVLSIFPVFLKSLSNYFFWWLTYKSLLAEFWCCNKLCYVVFQSFFYIHLFSTFFMSQVFLGPSPVSRSRVWV